MPIQYCISPPSSSNLHYRHHRFLTLQFKVSATCISPPPPPQSPSLTRRRAISLFAASSILYTTVTFSLSDSISRSKPSTPDFFEIENSGGVKALDLRVGDGTLPLDGDQVSIHYYGRLAAKQGWRFDSTYDHKDQTGEPIPFTFILGSGKVISGIEASVRSMKVGGIRRVIIPPSQGYQNMNQEPIPPNFFDRQRLFTTIFNPTRLSNGEGSTLGTLIFDIELVRTRHS
ncbi:peptidyl-prolyl cis-trans isomerase FKBP17-1, chloroplastic [Impatiens glandulifera]|uniref:peptidyl-prolyl cis-trans isomerase FKBP17-1, chloroplastic n=1 Tax=Impatiens glandulifera TaxID=253017 RepID=UPI001FB0B0D9|nr:peptidyl-prolyl cis-trans isomerase FKBP17-1, chloroplastic [Impatiens glandulifera]